MSFGTRYSSEPSPEKKAQSLPDDRYAPLKKVSDKLSDELSKEGVDQDRADLVTYRILKVMIEDPSGPVSSLRRSRKLRKEPNELC